MATIAELEAQVAALTQQLTASQAAHAALLLIQSADHQQAIQREQSLKDEQVRLYESYEPEKLPAKDP